MNAKSLCAPAHGERLHQIVVFELREDGTTEYSTMTLRALYNYVVRTITEACRQSNLERRGQQQQEQQPSGSQRHDESRGESNLNSGNSCNRIEEEVEYTPTTPCPPTTPPSKNILHMPSLMSSNATTPPTPITSHQSMDQSTDNHSPPSSDAGDVPRNPQQPQGQYPQQHHPLQHRAIQTAFTSVPKSAKRNGKKRLGGYLHPRDMRRLITPFSSSNEPQLIVRRHVMLLNFDPLRALVLKDRLLVVVPDGADSILIDLERRVNGGAAEVENQVFGASASTSTAETTTEIHRNPSNESAATINDDQWEDMQQVDWANINFELQSVDAVLETVIHMLMEDAHTVQTKAANVMSELRGETKAGSGAPAATSLGDHAQERLRLHKDEVKLMAGRVQGFVRAMNTVLDEDEDMTLMNLSRLLSHPERFLQPVSEEILHEESDGPELILEVYLHQALSIVNVLELLKGQILTTEEQISMTLDAVRNRLLYINTLLSVVSLCVSLGSFIGSIFGMNLPLPMYLQNSNMAFLAVTVGTVVGMMGLWGLLSWMFSRAASIHYGRSKHLHVK